jgi:hypothetical protein
MTTIDAKAVALSAIRGINAKLEEELKAGRAHRRTVRRGYPRSTPYFSNKQELAKLFPPTIFETFFAASRA